MEELTTGECKGQKAAIQTLLKHWRLDLPVSDAPTVLTSLVSTERTAQRAHKTRRLTSGVSAPANNLRRSAASC